MEETGQERFKRIENAKKRITQALVSLKETVKSETFEAIWNNKTSISASDLKTSLDAGKIRVRRIDRYC